MPPLSSKKFRVGPYSYGLAQECLESTEYESWMWDLARKTNLILDNGADELGQSLDPDIYRALIRQIHPYEIILPDKLQDSEYTLEQGRQFLDQGLPDGVSVMAVAQGSTWEEWESCYEEWRITPRINVIGVPYDIDFQLPWIQEGGKFVNREERRAHMRHEIIAKLIEESRVTRPLHLLGFNNLWEVEKLNRYRDEVRSIDTRGPFSAGLAGVLWDSNFKEKCWTTPDQSKVTEEEVQAALKAIDFNVSCLLNATEDYPTLSQWRRYAPSSLNQLRR